MWVWLRAHAVSFYGTYWQEQGWREYEFIDGRKPFEGAKDPETLLPLFRVALGKYMKQVAAHRGRGKLNPATVAWFLRQLEVEVAGDESEANSRFAIVNGVVRGKLENRQDHWVLRGPLLYAIGHGRRIMVAFVEHPYG